MRRIPPESSLGRDKETRGEIVEILVKVEQSGRWPQLACTTMFFLIPENVTSERRIALMPTLTRWLEALRAPEVATWQQKYRVEWDATEGRNGGAQRTVWEVLMEMERFKYRAGEDDVGAVALVLDLAKAVERVSLPVVWAWATHFASQGRFCECCAATLSTRGVCSSKDVRQWSCLLLRIVLQDAFSEVTKIYPSLKLRDSCG